jgi:hypothetical protein
MARKRLEREPCPEMALYGEATCKESEKEPRVKGGMSPPSRTKTKKWKGQR